MTAVGHVGCFGARAHAKLARAFCRDVLKRARRYLSPPGVAQALDEDLSPAELYRQLERFVES